MYKSKFTPNDVKNHLHDIRYKHQKELAILINECHRLRLKHKQIFDNQFNSRSIEKSYLKTNELIHQENALLDAPEFTEYLSESSYLFLENTQILTPSRNKTRQRCLSVSSVASNDKRANKVYEKWPDYTEICEILGYRIEKIPSIQTSSPPTSQPVLETNPKKRKKTTKFANAAKQVKDMPTAEREILKNIPMTIPKLPIVRKPIKSNEPKLPSYFCPSSKLYSKRIQTRQWLLKNSFSPQTLPLI